MPGIIVQHSILAICLIVIVEEAGAPLPVPFDLLVLFAGSLAARDPARLALWLAALTICSTLGSAIFFTVVRRGGRPLVDRFGRYAHIGPGELARGEEWLRKRGWLGIAAGRALPLLRLPVAVACALLGVSYARYLTAQAVGSAIYVLTFLLLGAAFGPALIEGVHIPRLALRLVGLAALGVGLPALLWRLSGRARAEPAPEPTRRQLLGGMVLASAAGAAAMSATWAAGATIAQLVGSERPLDLTAGLARWLIGGGMRPASAHALVYTGVVALCVALGVAYTEALRPRVAAARLPLLRQALALAALGGVVIALVLAPALVAPRLSSVARWWEAGGIWLALTLAAGLVSYGVTAACGHSLAVATFGQAAAPEEAPAVA